MDPKAELAAVLTEVKTLLAIEPDKMTAEQKQQLDKLADRGLELKTIIETREAEEKKRRDLDALVDFMDQPQHRIPRAVNADEDGRKTLLDAGWEIKNEMIYAPTSRNVLQEMYPEAVVFGKIPDGLSTEELNYIQTTRRSLQPDYRGVYTKMLKLKGRNEQIVWSQLSADEQKALTEGLDTAGGYVVPPDVQAEILTRLPMTAVMRANCRVITTSRDRVSFPRLQPNVNNGSIYTSGFVGDWAGETPAFADTDPALGLFEIQVKKIRVATRVSNDLLADAVVNFLSFLARDGAVNMALVEDNGFITGVGDALHPQGLANGGMPTVDVEGSTVNTISNTISNLGSAPKLINLSYQLPTQYQPRAKWLAHRLTESKIRQLVDAVGRWYWGTGLVGEGYVGQPDMFQGKPIMRSDFVAQDGTDANKVIYYGDFEAYIIVQRAQITSTILRERFADTDQTGIILWERVGGALWNTDAFRVGVV